MKPLYTENEYNNTKSDNTLPCECYQCGKTFYKMKKEITAFIKGNSKHAAKFCSKKCCTNSLSLKKKINCDNCNIEFEKKLGEIKRSINHFCSRSCSTTYNNTHKTYGNRRSKLEAYIEEQLTILYPKLKIDFNKKDTINSELDIYIPNLKLGFELNGIYHYEPIHGQDKLSKIQNNDQRKFQACLERDIELVLIDSSMLTYFKPDKGNKFVNIIVEIIDKKLGINMVGVLRSRADVTE